MAPAVNSPTNVKQKEADVNQKLQLYGIYSGQNFRHPVPIHHSHSAIHADYDFTQDSQVASYHQYVHERVCSYRDTLLLIIFLAVVR